MSVGRGAARRQLRAAGYDSLADGVARTPAAARPKVAPTGEFVAPFAALVGRWDLSAPPLGPEAVADGNRALYAAAARAYDAVRARLPPDTTATGVNHALFEWQMRVLRKTGAVAASLGPCPSGPTFKPRPAAPASSRAHGGDPAKVDAATCVSWISVHVVGDSDLALYDPRGARPFDAGGDGGGGRRVARPDAPFHRTVELPAAEGVLVLFPGWMVHQVLPSAASSRASETYRVSISVNFKGEWQDTTGLSLAFPPGPGTTFGS
ncbi:putative 2OG-Fe(II) oxygenase [Aureococcus anophagefferens]|nr:putative 2OG-Fe(II) oxygenase [Aureococcus anophagefferens]